MNEITKATVAFTAVGLLYIGLGIPLFLGRVKPNAWYGCRTRKTMSSERIWYAVNRVTGRDLIGAGIFIVVTSVLIYTFRGNVNPDYAVAVLLSVLVVSVIVMIINSIRAQNTM
jgi:uncharacterized membrane protein